MWLSHFTMTLRCVNRNEIVKKSNVVGDYGAKEAINTGKLSKILLCHPELRILCSERTESETRSNANNRECERSAMNDLFAWHTFSLAERKSMQKESKTGWLPKQLCHPEFISGSSPRKIMPSPENINNIPPASRTAKRKVRGGYAPPPQGRVYISRSSNNPRHNRCGCRNDFAYVNCQL